eukprot:9835612-Heterocapsa_arctica.AAC.1
MTDEEFWDIITETLNNKLHFHSFMINIIDKNKTLLKATPRGGLGDRKRPLVGKGPEAKKQDQGAHKWGDGGRSEGKGQNQGQWPEAAKTEGKGQTQGGYSAGGASSQYGGQNPAGAAPGVMKGGVEDPGPPPLPAQMDWNRPPQQWYAGQWLPASWLNGNNATWKQVTMGEVNPWDNRIAQSL